MASKGSFCKGKTPEKSCIGCNKENYWRYLRVAIWGNEGLPDCMKDSKRKGGRSKAVAEGVDAFTQEPSNRVSNLGL